jgi:hypothetical protein
VKSCFEGFIATNLMMQSEFNLVLWLVSYNIFSLLQMVGAVVAAFLSLLPLSRQPVKYVRGSTKYADRGA